MKRGVRVVVLVGVVVGFAPPVRGQARAGGSATADTTMPPGAIKPNLPKSLKVPTTYAELFAERDDRAVAAIGYVNCMQITIDALRSGALGAVPRDWSISCVRQGNEWRGVFGQLSDDAPGFVVRVQYAIAKRAIVTDRVDTSRVGGVARALFRGLSATLPGGGQFEVIPVVLPQPTFIEVWFLSVPSLDRPVVGGDSLIQMSSDGTRELGHARSGAALRVLTQPTGATWTIESNEERIPLMSELVSARRALDVVTRATVRTKQYDAVATKRAGAVVWTHTKR